MEEQKTQVKKQLISSQKLLETGIHFGHKASRWNPKMKPFIHGTKEGTHIIDLRKTVLTMENAYKVANKLASKGAKFLFVGTNKNSSEAVKLAAERTGNFYVNHRWLGGTLTNHRTVMTSVNKLREIERESRTDFAGYTKKESVMRQREMIKLEKDLGGIKFMRRLPQAVFVSSVSEDYTAIAEAKKLGIPVIGIVDTNADPASVSVPVVANDDSNKAVALVTTLIADAIATANQKPAKVAYLADEEIVIEGIVARPPRAPRPPRKNYRNNYN